MRAALRNGLSPAEIREVLLHTAIYAGVPAANAAFAIAAQTVAEIEHETGPPQAEELDRPDLTGSVHAD